MSKARRGEIWEVEFRPAVGAEIRKLRPAIVINAPEIGRFPLCIVVPVTEWKSVFAKFSWFVSLQPTAENGLMKDPGAGAFQVKSISEERLQRRLGKITDDQTELIAAAIALCVGC